jgi:hypothetical protein
MTSAPFQVEAVRVVVRTILVSKLLSADTDCEGRNRCVKPRRMTSLTNSK